MKIDDTQAPGLKGLVARQRNLVAAKEREIENVRNYFDAKKDTERVSGQKELIEVQDANALEISSALENKSSRLENVKSAMEKDLKRLEDERKNLSAQDDLEKAATNERLQEEQFEMTQSAIERSRDIAQRTNADIAELQKESQWQMAKASGDARKVYDGQIRLHEASLADKMRDQKVQLTATEIEHKQKLNQLQSEFEKDVGLISRSNVVNKNEREQQHLKDLKAQEDQYKYLLREKRKQFEQKYASLEQQHNDVIKRTEERFRSQLNSISSQYASTREAAAKRSEDPFYNLQRLSHRLESTPDSYLVHLDVAEHEVDNIIMSAHNRTIKLNFTRRYSDRVDGQNGQVDINKRSESFTQEFPVAEIVNSKEITRKYEDGVLTFQIKKA